MTDKDFIFHFDLCKRMTQWPCDTLEQIAQSHRKRTPMFQLFRTLFFIYPKMLEIKRKFRL